MSRALFMVPAAMSLIAIAPMPYGYYQFLKLVIFLAGGLIGIQFWTRGLTVLAAPFILLAVLFNPIFPVHLTGRTMDGDQYWSRIPVRYRDVGLAGQILTNTAPEQFYR